MLPASWLRPEQKPVRPAPAVVVIGFDVPALGPVRSGRIVAVGEQGPPAFSLLEADDVRVDDTDPNISPYPIRCVLARPIVFNTRCFARNFSIPRHEGEQAFINRMQGRRLPS